MSNIKDYNKKSSAKTISNKTNIWLMVIAVICVAAAIAVVLVGKNRDSLQKSKSSDVEVLEEGESLEIPISDISSSASFYQVKVDGVVMEILAIKADDGSIRTAFNTCQSCYTSGRGYYEADGEELVCQNCGFRFTADEVEVQSGGCNPWPIFEENKTITDDVISISYDYLSASKNIFAKWN